MSLAASESVIFRSPAGGVSSLSISGSVAALAFPAGLCVAEGGTASIRSSSVGSISVVMGTTWYAVDPSSNEGSVTFGGVGLLGTDSETVIGTADGTLPGSLNVELNGLQPGGGGEQSGSVLLGDDGTITIPPEVSAAVGQVFTDDHIAEFVATVNAGMAGMYGLQITHDMSIDGLRISTGQDIRMFSSVASVLTFTGAPLLSVAAGASLTISGAVLLSNQDVLAIGNQESGHIILEGAVIMSMPDGTVAGLSIDPVSGILTAEVDGRILGTLSRSNGAPIGTTLLGSPISERSACTWSVDIMPLVVYETHIFWSFGAGAVSVCLVGDISSALGQPCNDGCSSTVRIGDPDHPGIGDRMLDCVKPIGGENNGRCMMLDRLFINGGYMVGEVGLRRLRFANLHERSNGIGGAVYLSIGTLTVTDCSFEQNSGRSGGAIYVDGSTLTVLGSNFDSNSGPEGGGAIFSQSGDSTVTISDSRFTGNTAVSTGGGGNKRGGAICAGSGTLVLWGTRFDSNSATREGPAVFYSYGYTNAEANVAFGGSEGRRLMDTNVTPADMKHQQEIAEVKKGHESLQNRTRIVEAQNAALKSRAAALESIDVQITAAVQTISGRLEQCEAETAPFIEEMERRRVQSEETLCHGSGLPAMFAACCPRDNGGHRRFLQGQGCDVLPDTCAVACAPLFIEFFEGCQGMINDLTPEEQQEFAGLYTDCNEVEQQSATATCSRWRSRCSESPSTRRQSSRQRWPMTDLALQRHHWDLWCCLRAEHRPRLRLEKMQLMWSSTTRSARRQTS
eukprot:SAG22_NODE_1511_length_4257_cov_10.774651_2_plen_792_part_00